jgi:hypothetical protein
MLVLTGKGAAASYHPSINLDRLDGREYQYLCDAGFEDQALAVPFSDTVWRLHESALFIQKLKHKLTETSVHGYDVYIPIEVGSI